MGRDYRHRVYEWEGQWTHWNRRMFGSVHGPREWIRWACRKYRIRFPVVRALPSKGEMSYYCTLDHSINLQPVHWNAATALHEAAHAIIYWHTGDEFEDHGDEWMGVYAWLLMRAEMWPDLALSASARAFRIPWNPISPKQFKRQWCS